MHNLLNAIQDSTETISEHPDPCSVIDCYKFLHEQINDSYDTIIELHQNKNSLPTHIKEALNSGDECGGANLP